MQFNQFLTIGYSINEQICKKKRAIVEKHYLGILILIGNFQIYRNFEVMNFF